MQIRLQYERNLWNRVKLAQGDKGWATKGIDIRNRPRRTIWQACFFEFAYADPATELTESLKSRETRAGPRDGQPRAHTYVIDHGEQHDGFVFRISFATVPKTRRTWQRDISRKAITEGQPKVQTYVIDHGEQHDGLRFSNFVRYSTENALERDNAISRTGWQGKGNQRYKDT